MRFKKIALLIIIITFSSHLLVNFYIFNKSAILRVTDEADNINSSIRFHKMLLSKDHKAIARNFIIGPRLRLLGPLLGGVILTFLDKIGLKDIELMILLTNAFFLFILLISVYKIGAILYNEKVGLLAAVLVSFVPRIFCYTRVCMQELPLTAMVCLFLLCLLKTNYFSSILFSFITGILFGLTQFTKEIAIIFILPPFLYYSFKSLSFREGRKKRIINLSIAFLLFLLSMGIVFLNSENRGVANFVLQKALLSINAHDYLHYIKILPLDHLGIILSVFLIAPFFYYMLNIRKRSFFMTLWLLFPILFLSVFPNRAGRFITPILPALFLILIGEVYKSMFKIRKIYALILIFSAVFQYIIFSFFPNFPVYHPESNCGLFSIKQDNDLYTVEKLIDIFKKEQPFASEEKKVLTIFSTDLITDLESKFRLMSMPFFIDCPQCGDAVDALPYGAEDWQEYCLTADYILDKTGYMGVTGIYEDIGGKLKNSFENNYKNRVFKKISEFKTIDGDFVYVYKKAAE